MSIGEESVETQIGDLRCGIKEINEERYLYLERFDTYQITDSNDPKSPTKSIGQCWQQVITFFIPKEIDDTKLSVLKSKLVNTYVYARDKFSDLSTPEYFIEYALQQVIYGQINPPLGQDDYEDLSAIKSIVDILK